VEGDDMSLTEDGFCPRNSGRPDLYPHALPKASGAAAGRLDEVTESGAQPKPQPAVQAPPAAAAPQAASTVLRPATAAPAAVATL